MSDLHIYKGCSATFVITKMDNTGAAAAIVGGDDIQFTVSRYPGDEEAPLISLTSLTSGITNLTQSGATLGQCEAQIIPAHTADIEPGRYTCRVLLANGGNVSPVVGPTALFVEPV